MQMDKTLMSDTPMEALNMSWSAAKSIEFQTVQIAVISQFTVPVETFYLFGQYM